MYNLKDSIAHAAIKTFGRLPIDRKKIVFMSYRGLYFNDNPRAIYEEFLKRYPDYHYVWVLNDEHAKVAGAKIVRHGSIAEIYHLATARVWVDNKRKGEWLVKRDGQFYVQTWHAGVTMKKVEKDAEENLHDHYVRSAKHDSTITDVILSGSKWSTDTYRSSFWYDGKILETGLPRSDIFYKNLEKTREKVYSAYGLEREDRLILYAPTYREDMSLDCYGINYERLLESFRNRFGGTWKILVRLHANVAQHSDIITYSDSVLDGTKYEDINELIIASEFLISDYSSCMFDALEAGKKIVMFATDIEKYMKDRGTYFTLEELPGPLTRNNDELCGAIDSFDEKYYSEEIRKFMEERVQNYNNAHGAEKAVDYIIDRITEKDKPRREGRTKKRVRKSQNKGSQNQKARIKKKNKQ